MHKHTPHGMKQVGTHIIVAQPRCTRVLGHLRYFKRLRFHNSIERLPDEEELSVVQVFRRLFLWISDGAEFSWEQIEYEFCYLHPTAACGDSNQQIEHGSAKVSADLRSIAG